MDNELFESIYSQASAAREPMQESAEDIVQSIAEEFFAKEEAALDNAKENI